MPIDIRAVAKQILFDILRVRAINELLRRLREPLLLLLPGRMVGRIPVVGQVKVCTPDSVVVLLESDGTDSLASSLYWSGLQAFEPETVNLYMHLLRHASVVFDIGAYTGLYTLLAAVERRDRTVHAFEPVPKTFEALVRNVEVNNLDNVHPVWTAVADIDGETQLYIPQSTTLPFTASIKKGFRKVQTSTAVPVLTIDAYVEANGVPCVDLMKIDTEGTEHQVLRGARTVLERDSPLIICEVLKGLTETLLHGLLDGTSYRYFHITKAGLVQKEAIEGDENYTERNFLLIPEDRIRVVLQGLC